MKTFKIFNFNSFKKCFTQNQYFLLKNENNYIRIDIDPPVGTWLNLSPVAIFVTTFLWYLLRLHAYTNQVMFILFRKLILLALPLNIHIFIFWKKSVYFWGREKTGLQCMSEKKLIFWFITCADAAVSFRH